MVDFRVSAEPVMNTAQQISDIANRMKNCEDRIGSVKLSGIMDGSHAFYIDRSIKAIQDTVFAQAAKLDTLSDALKYIIEKYNEYEKRILTGGSSDGDDGGEGGNGGGTSIGGLLGKILEWLRRQEEAGEGEGTGEGEREISTTTLEEEQAANAQMRRDLAQLTNDPRFSQARWDAASTEERQQILQEYMDEVIKIYGLQDVNPTIVWDPNAEYNEEFITWGYYDEATHTVYLNYNALLGSIYAYDPFELFTTVSHELRHAYQHEAIAHPSDFMVSQETLDAWDENFDNYVRGEDDMNAYENQIVEQDASAFEIHRPHMRRPDISQIQ